MVFIIDYSGSITELETILAKWLKVRAVTIPKPISGSLCMTFWSTLIYICITNHFSILYVALCCLTAFSTKIILDLFYLLNDMSITVVRLIQKLISKI